MELLKENERSANKAAIEENSAGTENLGYMVKNIKLMSEELERLTK